MIERLSFIYLLFALLLVGCGKQPTAQKTVGVPNRIISMAPNITEIIYDLGLGGKLVGATTYCTYPEAAKKVPRVGGFGQYNFEALVSLKPDLVILHWKYEAEKERLQSLGIPYLETRTEYMADIIDSIQKVGAACGAEEKSNQIVLDMNRRMASRQEPSKAPPRVLVTFGGTGGAMDPIYAFGADCLHNELIELAGGKNVVENNLSFSTLSTEAVIRLNPDIIIQLAPGTDAPEEPSKRWNTLSRVNAVKHNRIYTLTGSYTCIPGPRFIRILDDFTEVIQHD